MGCDIHMVLERRIGDRWLGVNSFSGHHSRWVKPGEYDWYSPVATSRNYERFAALAGVRGEGPPPRGLPSDISELAALLSDEYGADGHSHSWMPLVDAVPLFLRTHWQGEPDKESLAWKYPASYFFNVESAENLGDYRLVFWFDN